MEKREFRSESSCKRPNKCKEFIFAKNCPPEYQDAFFETKGYKPKRHIMHDCEGQITLTINELEGNNGTD